MPKNKCFGSGFFFRIQIEFFFSWVRIQIGDKTRIHPDRKHCKKYFFLFLLMMLSLARWRGWSAVWAGAGGALRDLADCLCQVLPQPHTLEDVQGDVHELETQNRSMRSISLSVYKGTFCWGGQFVSGHFICPLWRRLGKTRMWWSSTINQSTLNKIKPVKLSVGEIFWQMENFFLLLHTW